MKYVLLILLTFITFTANADWRLGSIYCSPVDTVCGSGARVEYLTRNNWFVAADVQNMRFKDEYMIGPQAFFTVGKQFKWNRDLMLFGMKITPIARAGFAATTLQTESVSSYWRIKTSIGFEINDRFSVILDHASMADQTDRNHGSTNAVFSMTL